jgi:hypothetical protein
MTLSSQIINIWQFTVSGFLLCVLSCATAHPLIAQEIHPTESRLPVGNIKSLASGEASSDTILQRLSSYRDRLEKSGSIIKIGARDGREEDIFGEIKEVHISNDRIYVLDTKFSKIKVYAVDGSYVTSIGRHGSGPGDILRPLDFSIDSLGRIWVLNADRSVALFNNSTNRYTHIKKFKIDVNPQSICTGYNEAYVYGIPSPHQSSNTDTGNFSTLHLYDADGDLLKSFGPQYQSENYAIADIMSTSSDIHCTDMGSVVVQYKYIPLVISVNRRSGTARWSTHFIDHTSLKAQEISQAGRAGVRLHRPKDNTIFGSQLVSDKSTIISQFAVSSSGNGKTRSYVIDAHSGRALRFGRDTNDVLFSIDQDVVVFGSNLPFPSIKIVRLP